VRPATLRFRLIGAAALATLAAVALLGIAVELLLSSQLHSSLDSSLRQRGGQVARLSASAPALLTTPGTLDAPLGGRELSVEVVDRQGRIVARSSSLGGRVLPGGALQAGAIGRARPGYVDAHLGSEPIRLYVAPIADAGGPAAGGAVLVASSTSEIDDTLGRLRSLIALSAGGAALLGALAAALLTSRGLRPLRRLSAAARGIEATGDAGRRLPDPDTDDEVGELARTLNRMLGALERARQTERRFLADASHELRTPLTALRGNAAYIARHGADREAMADLEADAARLGRLLDDLLALERAAGGEVPHDVIALEQVVDEVARRTAEVDVVAREPVAVSGERPGSGLGLAIVAAIAERHGGRLEIDGARFTLDLPALKRLSETGATVP
jgi:signal transduction histidine kinase